MKNVLIVGAGFENKGAQSMLFVTVSEIIKHYPNAVIYHACAENYDESQFRFIKLFYDNQAMLYALKNSILLKVKFFIKDCIKFVIGRHNNLWKYNQLKKKIKSIDLIIDISGYNIGKKWSIEIQESYLNNIRLAKKYNIPMVIMPQSFGPFDYPEDKKSVLKDLKELLPYPDKIFAREREGFEFLSKIFKLSNVELSTDLVLQNKGISLESIFNKNIIVNVPKLQKKAVGIVPNTQCFRHGNKDKNLEIYNQIIKKLIEKGKEVYLFRHSFEDLEVCKEIYKNVDHKHVSVLYNDFSCIEYDEFIKQFDFIVCSRYHGNVHAYRNFVPAILLGWSVKYTELAEILGQSQYVFDITKTDINTSDIVTAVEKMCDRFMVESNIIKSNLEQIQNENCFDRVFR